MSANVGASGMGGLTASAISAKASRRIPDGRITHVALVRFCITCLIPIGLSASVIALSLEEHLMNADEIAVPGKELSSVMNVVTLHHVRVGELVPNVLNCPVLVADVARVAVVDWVAFH